MKTFLTAPFLIIILTIFSCNKAKEPISMDVLKNKTAEEQIIRFKNDTTLLKSYVLSIYDTIELSKNQRLNIFTSNPQDYKNKVISSLNDLDIQSPLFGLPIVVKDNFNTKDFPTSAGTPALENFIPKDDAPIIEALKNAGAVIIGKTNMHELAFGITSNNAFFGSVKNPYDPTHFAGGSSGGTAVAIATGIVNIGLGTDTGGSCRIPAALCGVFGYRPTSGRYNANGITPLSATRDTPGILAKYMEDIILLDQVISKEKTISKVEVSQLRIGIPTNYFYDDISPEVKRISDIVIKQLKKHNITLVEVALEGLPALLSESINIVLHETHRDLPTYLSTYETGITLDDLSKKIASPDVKGLFDVGAIAPHPNYDKAIKEERPNLQKAYQACFEKNNIDALLYPTTPLEAMPIKGSDETVLLNGRQVPTFATYIRNMNPGSYAGMPGVTFPAGTTKTGLPVGMHLESLPNTDVRLLQISKLINQLIEKNAVK